MSLQPAADVLREVGADLHDRRDLLVVLGLFAGARFRINISPDLSVSSYIQYDTDTKSVGTNTRLRWTFRPVADLFVVYNHNVRSILDRWRLDSNQLLVKLQYAFRMSISSVCLTERSETCQVTL